MKGPVEDEFDAFNDAFERAGVHLKGLIAGLPPRQAAAQIRDI